MSDTTARYLCEGCGKPATTMSEDGYDLCEKCHAEAATNSGEISSKLVVPDAALKEALDKYRAAVNEYESHYCKGPQKEGYEHWSALRDAYGCDVDAARAAVESLFAAHVRTHSGKPVQVDNPEFDGTDSAHPAYWRGEDASFNRMVLEINDILDGKDDGLGVSCEPWQSLRRRLRNLVKPAPSGGK